MFLVAGFGGKKRGDDEDYLAVAVVVVAKGSWSGCSREENLGMCSSVKTWGVEGCYRGDCGAVSSRGGGGMPWS